MIYQLRKKTSKIWQIWHRNKKDLKKTTFRKRSSLCIDPQIYEIYLNSLPWDWKNFGLINVKFRKKKVYRETKKFLTSHVWDPKIYETSTIITLETQNFYVNFWPRGRSLFKWLTHNTYKTYFVQTKSFYLRWMFQQWFLDAMFPNWKNL